MVPIDLIEDRCSSLKEITIPSSMTSFKNYTFQGCSLLARITIPFFETTIGDTAFNGCHSLSEIIFPSSVGRIGEYSFSDCSSLKQIEIPSSIKSEIIVFTDALLWRKFRFFLKLHQLEMAFLVHVLLWL
ncbi:hypothetical protein M9Y10_038825 [Tritrichomonas musculus]|uniref:Surface antigen BspA-like n=1 Tax=Tritrichomonas musculus TaxID=1915356 RepID=A0ABR2K9N7_9EUKA